MSEAFAAVSAAKLRKSFGFRAALDSIDLEIAPGEFVALFGPNGAGKTTLLKCISGLASPTDGTVRVFGGDPRRSPQVRRRIGLVSHLGFLHDSLTGAENLQLYATLYDVPNPSDRIAAALQSVRLSSRAGDLVGTYSRGMRQRLAIARATLHDPDLLLLDEPFSGLDRHGCQQLGARLAALVREGRSVVLVTHEFQETLPLATRVIVLVKGRIALDRPLTDADRDAFIDEYMELALE